MDFWLRIGRVGAGDALVEGFQSVFLCDEIDGRRLRKEDAVGAAAELDGYGRLDLAARHVIAFAEDAHQRRVGEEGAERVFAFGERRVAFDVTRGSEKEEAALLERRKMRADGVDMRRAPVAIEFFHQAFDRHCVADFRREDGEDFFNRCFPDAGISQDFMVENGRGGRVEEALRRFLRRAESDRKRGGFRVGKKRAETRSLHRFRIGEREDGAEEATPGERRFQFLRKAGRAVGG